MKSANSARKGWSRMMFCGGLLSCLSLLACDATLGGGGEDGSSPSLNGRFGGPGDGDGDGDLNGDAVADCELQPARIWKLTPQQYRRSVESVLPTAPDVSTRLSPLGVADYGYSNDAARMDMSVPDVERLFLAASDLAEHVVESQAFSESHPCVHQANPVDECLQTLLGEFGQRTLRGGMTAEEVSEYLAYFREREGRYDSQVALRSIIHAMFLSPRFIYRPELGGEVEGGVSQLTPHEVAQLISYSLSDGPPDDELWAQAESGELAQANVVESAVQRLLASAESAPAVLSWLDQMFNPGAAVFAPLNPSHFDDFDPEIIDAMVEETREFFKHVLWEEGGDYRQLFEADYSMVNADLAAHYGSPGAAVGEAFQKTTLPDRYGVLTQGAMMLRLSSESEQDPIKRGRFVREVLLCDEVPPVPADLNVVFPEPSESETVRERLKAHSDNPGCSSCHEFMDPIGFAFGNYNAVGEFVTEEAGKPIDTSGYIVQGAGEQIPLSDISDLAAHLASSERTAECMTAQAFRHAMGRREVDGVDACALGDVTTALMGSGGNLLELQAALLLRPGALSRLHVQEN